MVTIHGFTVVPGLGKRGRMDYEKSPLDVRLQCLLTDRFVTGASVAYVQKDSIEVAVASRLGDIVMTVRLRSSDEHFQSSLPDVFSLYA